MATYLRDLRPVILVDIPALNKHYATRDIEIGGVVYEGRLAEAPQISRPIPEFVAGIEFPAPVDIVLVNGTDKAITILRQSNAFRGLLVIITEAFLDENDALIESDVLYRGLITQTKIGYDYATLTLSPQDLEVLEQDFPFEETDTTKWSTAIDLGFPIPLIIGTAKKIPLALVKAFESSTVGIPDQYQYLVGRGDVGVDVLYRDDLVLQSYPSNANGIPQSVASNTVKLAVADTKNDDFYNDLFFLAVSGPGAGNVRRITDYVGGATNTVTLESSGSFTTSTRYVIREWKKITQVISTITYTLIEFAVRQREGDVQLTRDRMLADVTGLQTERNPAKAIQTILGLYGVFVNAAAFTNAANTITSIGNLFVDGAAVEKRKLVDVINEFCLIGRIYLRINDSREYEPLIDDVQSVISANFSTEDNIVELGAPVEEAIENVWKTLVINYRRQFSGDEYRLKTAQHTAVSAGKINQELNFDFIFDKNTGDKVCDYLAKRKRSLDEILPVTLGHEARGLGNLNALFLDAPQISRSGNYQIVGSSPLVGRYGFNLIPKDDTVFTWTLGTIPSDPVTDNTADFRKTPPAAVTGLAVNWTITALNVSAQAVLSWIKPAVNWDSALVEYKLTADSIYTSVGFVNGTSISIPGLTPGASYDFQITSYNFFGLDGGVAQITGSVAPGDTTAPGIPSTPGAVVRGSTFEFETTPRPANENVRAYIWQLTNSVGTNVGQPFEGGTKIVHEAGSLIGARRAKVAAQDLAGLQSAYSGLSTSVSTGQWGTGDYGDNTVTTPKIPDNTVTNQKLNSISANKMTLAGTLTLSGAQTVLDVTNSGVAVWRSGADIDFRSSASDSPQLLFKNSALAARGNLGYLQTSNVVRLQSVGCALRLDSGSAEIQIGAAGGGSNIRVAKPILVNTALANETLDIGEDARAFGIVYCGDIDTSDISMENGIVLTESYNVYVDAEPGFFLMSPDWEPMIFFGMDGSIKLAGQVETGVKFKKPTKESKWRTLKKQRKLATAYADMFPSEQEIIKVEQDIFEGHLAPTPSQDDPFENKFKED